MSAAGVKACSFSQTFNLTGRWSRSPSPSFHGFYNMTADCPPYAQDFDCQTPQKFGAFVGQHHLSHLKRLDALLLSARSLY